MSPHLIWVVTVTRKQPSVTRLCIPFLSRQLESSCPRPGGGRGGARGAARRETGEPGHLLISPPAGAGPVLPLLLCPCPSPSTPTSLRGSSEQRPHLLNDPNLRPPAQGGHGGVPSRPGTPRAVRLSDLQRPLPARASEECPQPLVNKPKTLPPPHAQPCSQAGRKRSTRAEGAGETQEAATGPGGKERCLFPQHGRGGHQPAPPEQPLA